MKLAFAPDLALPVEYAAVADALVAVHDGKLTLLEPDAYTVTPVAVLDRTTRLARVEVTGAGIELDPAAIAPVLARATVLTAADLAGIAREALTRTVAYDKERVQFGKPVGSFQILKHTLADLHIAVDDGRARRAVRRLRDRHRTRRRGPRRQRRQGQGERRRP